MHFRYFSSETILVALLLTLSMERVSCFRYGHHTFLAYSICEKHYVEHFETVFRPSRERALDGTENGVGFLQIDKK